MIIKPSISFIGKSTDTELLKATYVILDGMTGNPNFPNPDPPLNTIAQAASDFSNALAAAAGGGILLTNIKNNKRLVLEDLLRRLAIYVQANCNNNLTNLLSSGFKSQKTGRTRSGIPATPSDLTISYGSFVGQLIATISPVPTAVNYNWRIFAASAPMVIVQAAQTTMTKHAFNGLTPGVVYSIQVNSFNSAGTSDWSNLVPKMAV